jgi:hypothetical protein
MGKFNSRKTERSEKIKKDTMDKGRWNRDMLCIRGNGRPCTDEVKEESRQVHSNRERCCKQNK